MASKRLTAKQQIKRIDDARKHLEAAAVLLMDVPDEHTTALAMIQARTLSDVRRLAREAARRQQAMEARDE